MTNAENQKDVLDALVKLDFRNHHTKQQVEYGLAGLKAASQKSTN